MKPKLKCAFMAAIFIGAPAWMLPAAAAPSLDVQIRALEDEDQIRDLMRDYTKCLAAKDIVCYSQLFSKDGAFRGKLGTVSGGPAAIRKLLEHTADFDKTRPGGGGGVTLYTNISIEIDGDRATALSKWLPLRKGADGKPVFAMAGHYQDVLVREDGRWKFLSRVIPHDMPSDVEDGRKAP